MEAVTCGRTNRVSSTRIIMLMSAVTLSVCSLAMTVGLFFKDVFAMPLSVTTPLLATMAGAGYVAQRMTGGTTK
jgi:hypothetical protein